MIEEINNGEVTSMRKDRMGLQIDGKWYGNKFNEVPATINKGDRVNAVVKDGKFWNKLNKVGGGSVTEFPPKSTPTAVPAKPEFPVPIDSRGRSIIRQNALGHATTVCMEMYKADYGEVGVGHDEALAQRIVEIAKIFETYAAGDAERIAADPKLSSELEKMIKDAS